MSDETMPIIKTWDHKGEKMFLIGKSGVGIQLTKDEALYTARLFALLLGFSLVDRSAEIKLQRLKANENSTKEYPLGKSNKNSEEEHL